VWFYLPRYARLLACVANLRANPGRNSPEIIFLCSPATVLSYAPRHGIRIRQHCRLQLIVFIRKENEDDSTETKQAWPSGASGGSPASDVMGQAETTQVFS